MDRRVGIEGYQLVETFLTVSGDERGNRSQEKWTDLWTLDDNVFPVVKKKGQNRNHAIWPEAIK